MEIKFRARPRHRRDSCIDAFAPDSRVASTQIICTAVVNQTLSMDAIIEEITEDLFADEVQSMSMTSMSLL